MNATVVLPGIAIVLIGLGMFFLYKWISKIEKKIDLVMKKLISVKIDAELDAEYNKLE